MIVDNPPVNAMSQAVREGLLDAVHAGIADRETRALMLICSGRTFIAGADIKEFGQPMIGPTGRDVILAFEASPKPIVAASHGTAFGGGLETAFGCHYRIAHVSSQVGLPEVKLGLLPGGGGTQRLPRLVGAEVALEMVTSGAPISAEKARDLGIVDFVVEGNLEAAAIEFVAKLDFSSPAPRIRDRPMSMAATNPEVFAAKRRAVADQARAPFAALRCVDAVEAAFKLPFDAGLERERELFLECLHSDESATLIRAFFAEREASKARKS